MWLSSKILDIFRISKESVDALREDLSAVRAERDALQSQMLTTQANFEWLRIRVNALEVERAQLIKKAYNIDLPIPEIVKPTRALPEINSSIFDDMGDDLARKFGLPAYNDKS